MNKTIITKITNVFLILTDENICEACHGTILPSGGLRVPTLYFVNHFPVGGPVFMLCLCVVDMAQPFSVVVFNCRHMFHKECLPSSGTVSTTTRLPA